MVVSISSSTLIGELEFFVLKIPFLTAVSASLYFCFFQSDTAVGRNATFSNCGCGMFVEGPTIQ